MFSQRKVRVEQTLYERTKHLSAQLGYVSVHQFVTHLLERELSKKEEQTDDEKVAERLRGLGYIE